MVALCVSSGMLFPVNKYVLMLWGCLSLASLASATSNDLAEQLLAAGTWHRLEQEACVFYSDTRTNLTDVARTVARAGVEMDGWVGPAARLQARIFLVGQPAVWQQVIRRNGCREDSLAMQWHDDLFILDDGKPVELSFRLAHEMAHWRLHKAFADSIPLWLEEGLAQQTGRRVAGLALPPPEPVGTPVFTVTELTTMTNYPPAEATGRRFYYQSELLLGLLTPRVGGARMPALLRDAVTLRQPLMDVLKSRFAWTGAELEALEKALQKSSVPPKGIAFWSRPQDFLKK